eukprot:PhM_4_TR16653/c0_g1_i1/m.63471
MSSRVYNPANYHALDNVPGPATRRVLPGTTPMNQSMDDATATLKSHHRRRVVPVPVDNSAKPEVPDRWHTEFTSHYGRHSPMHSRAGTPMRDATQMFPHSMMDSMAAQQSNNNRGARVGPGLWGAPPEVHQPQLHQQQQQQQQDTNNNNNAVATSTQQLRPHPSPSARSQFKPPFCNYSWRHPYESGNSTYVNATPRSASASRNPQQQQPPMRRQFDPNTDGVNTSMFENRHSQYQQQPPVEYPDPAQQQPSSGAMQATPFMYCANCVGPLAAPSSGCNVSTCGRCGGVAMRMYVFPHEQQQQQHQHHAFSQDVSHQYVPVPTQCGAEVSYATTWATDLPPAGRPVRKGESTADCMRICN